MTEQSGDAAESQASDLLVGVIVGFAAALVSGIVFGLVLEEVLDRETLRSLDHPVLAWIVDLRSGPLNDIARFTTNLASSWVVAPVVTGVSAVLLYRRRRALAAFIVAATGGTAILTSLAKSAAGRQRPPAVHRLVDAGGWAFPSGHSSQALAFAFSLAVVVWCVSRSRRVALLAFPAAVLFTLVVGATRVYLGVHWPTDVVGGWLLATAWVGALSGLYALVALVHHRARQGRSTLNPNAEPPFSGDSVRSA